MDHLKSPEPKHQIDINWFKIYQEGSLFGSSMATSSYEPNALIWIVLTGKRCSVCDH